MPNALGLLADPRGEMRATPRNKLMGLLADALTAANDYAQRPDPTMPMGKANPVLGLLADAASLNSLATTAQRASYGEPLTNGLRGSKAFLKPETADVAMMAPISPRNALAALGLVGGMADTGAMRAATVWHGSPHKFDRFDASKIGTGEGAQAYGHGLYFAESPQVAKSYTTAGTSAATTQSYQYTDPIKRAAATVEKAGGDVAFAIRRLSADAERGDEIAAKAISHLKSGAALPDLGLSNLYKVDLPDEAIAKMLDWDKPLSQQAPEVIEAARKALPPRYVNGRYVDPYRSGATGQALMDQLRMLANAGPAGLRTPEAALQSVGVPGIRYLDGGSRGAGSGTSNFVVFPGNEDLLTIIERNGGSVR